MKLMGVTGIIIAKFGLVLPKTPDISSIREKIINLNSDIQANLV